jgi:aminocarboxymuconate-semialdehyde decarboxylase
MAIDIHSHVIPEGLLDMFERDAGRSFGVSVERAHDGARIVRHAEGYQYPLPAVFYDLDRRLQDMAAQGIDGAVLSLSPTMFFYDAAPAAGARLAAAANEALRSLQDHPSRCFRSLGVLPLQDAAASLAELDHVARLGLCGVHIGTRVGDRGVTDPAFAELWAALERRGMMVLLHPYYTGDRPGLGRYYYSNLIGNPLDTAVALADLIFSGTLERHPGLKVCLVHGGGFLPYQVGRLDRGFAVRPETQGALRAAPSTFMRRVYFDTITHHPLSLRFLVEMAGADRVLLGSDFPFDMGDPAPRRFVDELPLGDAEKAQILGGNARALAGWD